MSKRTGRPQRRGRLGRETGCSRGPRTPGQAVCVRVQEVGAALASREGGRGRPARAGWEWGSTQRKAHRAEGGGQGPLPPLGETAWVLNGDCGVGTPAVSPGMGDPQ